MKGLKITGGKGGRLPSRKVVKVKMWYNRQERSWVVQRFDRRGIQVGEADYVGNKEHALKLKKEYEAKIKKGK